MFNSATQETIDMRSHDTLDQPDALFANGVARHILNVGITACNQSEQAEDQRLIDMYRTHVDIAYQDSILNERPPCADLDIEVVLKIRDTRYIYPIHIPGKGIFATRMPEGTLEKIPHNSQENPQGVNLPFKPGYKQLHENGLYIMTLDTTHIHRLDDAWNVIETIPVPGSQGKQGLIAFQVMENTIELYHGNTSEIATISMDGTLLRTQRMPHLDWIMAPTRVGSDVYFLSSPTDNPGELLRHNDHIETTYAGLHTPIHMNSQNDDIVICDKRGVHLLRLGEKQLAGAPTLIPVTRIEHVLGSTHNMSVRHACFQGDDLFIFADGNQRGAGFINNHAIVVARNILRIREQ